MKRPLLTIVVPCFNEEDVLSETISQLSNVMSEMQSEKLISGSSKILFVDDGSADKTWSMIYEQSKHNPFVSGLKLSRNVGHQKALLAGLQTARHKSDCVISIDADLQDDVRVIRDFVLKYHEGYDIVYGVRGSRKTDTWFKRTTAVAFYRLMNKIGIRLVPNHADYRLMSKRAVEELSKYDESNVFLRGIVPLVGFSQTTVTYDRQVRFAGKSKYSLRKMLSFAFDGIASFSVAPIRFVTFLGFSLALFGLATGIYALVQKLVGQTNAGWTSLIVSIWLIGGLQLMAVGLIGEYIGKIFVEVKGRPKYAVDIDLYSDSLLRMKPKTSS